MAPGRHLEPLWHKRNIIHCSCHFLATFLEPPSCVSGPRDGLGIRNHSFPPKCAASNRKNGLMDTEPSCNTMGPIQQPVAHRGNLDDRQLVLPDVWQIMVRGDSWLKGMAHLTSKLRRLRKSKVWLHTYPQHVLCGRAETEGSLGLAGYQHSPL